MLLLHSYPHPKGTMQIAKQCATLRQAEKFRDQLYAKWERVELVRAPIFGEQGPYVFEVTNK